MEPYLVEIICKLTNNNIDSYHASICAIAESEEIALVMAQDIVLSHGYLVEQVLGGVALNPLPDYEVGPIDIELYKKALQSDLKCVGVFVTGSAGQEVTEIHELKNLNTNSSCN